jgi:MFS family permease
VFFTILGGPLTDKLGRKRATFIFDTISWSAATIVWAIAQDFNYFLLAAVLNAAWRVPMTSWTCLMVEDTDPDDLVDIYSWINIAGLLSAFFAPIAGILISANSLVPTMRGLYWFAFVLMTIKFIWLNVVAVETKQGVLRMQQTQNQSIFSMLGEYRGVFGILLRTPKTLYTLGIMLVMSISNLAGGTFWAVLATERVGIPDEHLAIFPFARSIIMLFFFFLVMPRIREMHFRRPMLVGFTLLIVSQLLLITAPSQGYLFLLLSVFLEACSLAVVTTLRDKMMVVNVDAQERARIMSLMYLVVIVLSSPFGWIAGALSEVSKVLPFVLTMGMYALGFVLTYLASRKQDA